MMETWGKGETDKGLGRPPKSLFSFTGCDCNLEGVLPEICDDHGRCLCRPGVEGPQCDACRSGFYSFPICQGKWAMQHGDHQSPKRNFLLRRCRGCFWHSCVAGSLINKPLFRYVHYMGLSCPLDHVTSLLFFIIWPAPTSSLIVKHVGFGVSCLCACKSWLWREGGI